MVAWNLGILQLLCQFDHPDWNLDWARETLSFIKVLDQLQERYSNVKDVLGIDPHTKDGEDMYSSTAKKLTWIRTFFEGRLGKADVCVESRAPDVPNFDLPQDTEFIDFIDGTLICADNNSSSDQSNSRMFTSGTFGKVSKRNADRD
jgi:hypothetical protein